MAQRALKYVLAYGLWLLSAGVALFAAARIRQFLLIDFPIMVLLRHGLSRYGQRAIDRFGTVTLGLIWLVFVIASESFFRQLAEEQVQPRRIVRLFAAEALILVLAYAGSVLVT